MLYRYEVVKGKKVIRGVSEAISEGDMIERLSRLYGMSARIKVKKHNFLGRAKKRVSASMKMLFYRQMEAMVKCGIPLPDGLRLAAASIPDANFSLSILDIEAEVLQG